MNDLFRGDPPTFKPDHEHVRGPQRSNTVAQRWADIPEVINELEVDVPVIVEDLNRSEELQLFLQ